MTKRRLHAEPRRFWTKDEIRQCRKLYPHQPTADVAKAIDRSVEAVYRLAWQRGWRKTAAYLASPAAYRLDGVKGMGTRFQPGQTPPNKGLRRPGWGPGRMKQTQFKKDQMPHNWKPVGTTRINSEGYRDIKITDLRRGALDWRGLHRLNWIAVHGAIPKTHFLRFRDGDRLNPLVENLELVTRAEHLRRNYHDRYPLEIKQLVQLRGAVNRQINKREGKHEKQDRGLTQSPVRHAGGSSGQGEAHGDRESQGHQRRSADDHQQRKGRSGLHEDARGSHQGKRIHSRGKADRSAKGTRSAAPRRRKVAERQQIGS